MGATQDIADFVVRRRAAASPNAAATGRVLADTVAVAIAGADTEPGRLLLDCVLAEARSGPARVWGSDLCLAPSQAALLNGMNAHALDWDDAVPGIPFHPGAVMMPALLAQLALDPASGQRLAVAYDVGSAVSRAVSEVLPVELHYDRGWHNTSTTGRLAATAAVAHLVGLDESQTRHALGIVASSVAGLLANFGTMTKPLHAGQAAQDAVRAVALARRGFTAHEHLLEAPRGFFAAYGRTTPEALATLPERLDHWEAHWVDDWALKRHPSCFATHRAVDAALALRRQVGDPDRIAGVRVSVPAWKASPLLTHLPTTGLEGKFSLDYTVARALVSGPLTLADFTDERVHDPVVRRLMAAYATEQREGPGDHHTTVTVTLTDGSTLSHGVDVTYGDASDPLTDDDLAGKVTSALDWAGWEPEAADALLARLLAAPADSDLTWVQDALGVPA